MSYLLDTCILSKLRKLKTHPDQGLSEWFSRHSEDQYFISVISIGEIQKGIAKLKEEEQQKKMIFEDWLVGNLIPRFQDRILKIDAHTTLIWGEISGKAQKKGFPFPAIDFLLAASAIQHSLVLVTENIRDFIPTGCRLLNPCDSFLLNPN